MMSVTAFALLRPALLVAKFVGLVPYTSLEEKGLLNLSKPIYFASLSFVLFFYIPQSAYIIYLKFFLDDILEQDVGNIFSYCILFVTLLHLVFGCFYSWHFVSTSCRMLSKILSSVHAAEKILGRHEKCFRTQLIWAYQMFVFAWQIALSVSMFVAFTTKGRDWTMQLLVNATRMQIFTIEQLVVAVNEVFVLKYQQIKKILHQYHHQEKYKRVI